jgi:Tol biopolymer transport system component
MSYSFSHDGKRIVMSAVKKGKGQSDIFIFSITLFIFIVFEICCF